MNIKRILAVLIAVLMALTVFPLAAFAEGDPVPDGTQILTEKDPEKGNPTKSLTDHTNAAGTFISWSSSSPAWTQQSGTFSDGTTYYYVQSGNAGQSSTDSDLKSETFYMNQGETIKFQYWFESESNYDKFLFLDNGSEVFSGSGNSGGGSSPAWTNYTYTCSTSGYHTFVFRYHKDGSNNTGADCAKVYGVNYSRHYSWYLSRALMNEGMAGNIFVYSQTSQYPFNVGGTGSGDNGLYLYNGNKGVDDSTSAITVSAWVERAPVDFLFDYAYESEANYDFFNFYVNDERIEHMSGTGDYNWHSYTYTINTAGFYTFRFEYKKDGSNSSGSDQVCIDNLRFSALDSEDRANDYNYTWSDESNLNSSYSDAWLTFNSPVGTGGFIGRKSSDGTGYYAICNNRYKNDVDATIETIVNMAAGETLSFQYIVSSEKTYDRLAFYANGEEKMTASGWDNNSSWTLYTFTAPSTGSYVFKWAYEKDSTDCYGLDYAAIANVKYTGNHNYGSSSGGWGYHNAFTAEQALIADAGGGECSIDTQAYDGYEYFMPYKDENGTYMISRNRYYESTSSYMEIWCYNMLPGDSLYYQYKVSAETADKLYINIDGVGDNDYSHYWSGEGTSATWHYDNENHWVCTTPGTVVVTFEFRKDYSVNTADDCALIRNFTIQRASAHTLDEAMRKEGQDMTFTSSGTYHWEAGYHVYGSSSSPTVDLCAVPTNRGNLTGGGTATAAVSTTVFLNYGDQFKFEYICWLSNSTYSDWTPNFTWTVQAPGSSTLLNLDQTANIRNWTTRTYTAFTTGFYTFTWTYSRPERGWEIEPTDEVCVRNCEIVNGIVDWPSLYSALNVDDGTLQFNNGADYGWWSDYWFEDSIATSANIGQSSSDATLTTTVQMNAGDKLRFQYYVSSEQNYDYLIFRVNGSTVFTESGLVDWEWYDWTAPSAGSYQFEWVYHKDSSINRGLDCAKLDFVELIPSGSPVGLLGDVNSDGFVNANDALLLMRYALGLVSASQLDLSVADYNQNGTTDANDALAIMRHALGLSK